MLSSAILLFLQLTAVFGGFIGRPISEPLLSQRTAEIQKTLLDEYVKNIVTRGWSPRDESGYFTAFTFNGKINLTLDSIKFVFEGNDIIMQQYGGKVVFAGDYQTWDQTNSAVTGRGVASGFATVNPASPFYFKYEVDYETGAKHCPVNSFAFSDLQHFVINFSPEIHPDSTALKDAKENGLNSDLYWAYYKLPNLLCEKLIEVQQVDNKWEDKLDKHHDDIRSDVQSIVKKLVIPDGDYWSGAVAELTITSVNNIKISFDNEHEFHVQVASSVVIGIQWLNDHCMDPRGLPVKASEVEFSVTTKYGPSGSGTLNFNLKLKINEQASGSVEIQAEDTKTTVAWTKTKPRDRYERTFLKQAMEDALGDLLKAKMPQPIEALLF